jgi:hypothetical protein
MKPKLNNVCLSFFIILLTACNSNSGKKDQPTDTTKTANATADSVALDDVDCSTIGNFLVSSQEADKMIKKFRSVFKKTNTAGEIKNMVDSFWIDASIILAYQNLFATEPSNYDGIRLHFLGRANSGDSTDIALVPCKANSNGTGFHDEVYGNKITVPGNTEFKNYNVTNQQIIEPRKHYGRIYRNEKVPGQVSTATIDSVSKSIWFSKCVLDALKRYLASSELGLDGVRVYCAAYDTKRQGSSQLKDIQSTVVLVVTRPDGVGRHKSDWSILERKFRNDPKFNIGGYNHGELCPRICD